MGRHTQKKSSEGFTLIEVVIAMVILAFGILGVATMQIRAIKGNASANHMSEASIVASDQAEWLLDLDFDDAALNVGSKGSKALGNYQISWAVAAGPSAIAESRAVTVTVAWESGGVNHTFDYRFLKSRSL